MRHQPEMWPPPRFYQALLEDFSLSDPSGIVSSVSDQADGTCDIALNAIAGVATFTLPILDFFGGPIDTVTGTALLQCMGSIIGVNNYDDIFIGFRDSVNGNQAYGTLRVNGDVGAAGFGGAGGINAIGADVIYYAVEAGGDELARYSYCLGYDASNVYQGTRGNTATTRSPCAIDEFYVRVKNNGANAQTLTIEAGFYIAPSIPDINAIAARL